MKERQVVRPCVSCSLKAVLRAMQVAAIRLTATATYISTVNVHTGRETSSFSVPFGALQASEVGLSSTPLVRTSMLPCTAAACSSCLQQHVRRCLNQMRRGLLEVHAHSSVKMQVIPVPSTVREGTTEQSVYLLAGGPGGPDNSPALQLLPDTPTAQAVFAAMDHDMYFWRHDATTGEAPAVQFCLPLAVHRPAVWTNKVLQHATYRGLHGSLCIQIIAAYRRQSSGLRGCSAAKGSAAVDSCVRRGRRMARDCWARHTRAGAGRCQGACLTQVVHLHTHASRAPLLWMASLKSVESFDAPSAPHHALRFPWFPAPSTLR